MTVNDASGGRQLVRSEPLSPGTVGWQSFSLKFSTGPATEAVVVALHREGCTTEPCPIFGGLNLDSFSLERVR